MSSRSSLAMCICVYLGLLFLPSRARAEEPLPVGEYIGCGHAIAPSACEGCYDSLADNCVCGSDGQVSICQSNQKICFNVPRAFRQCQQNESGCRKVYRREVYCWQRKRCNNASGVDGGNCEASGNCTLSDDYVKFDGPAFEYYEQPTACSLQ